MNRQDRERLERRRRMLAREQGLDPGEEPAGVRIPPREPPRTRYTAPAREQTPEPASNLRPISPVLRRRRRRKHILLALVILVLAAAMATVSGLLSTSIAMLGDMTDSVVLYLNRAGGGWPASTGIRIPTQVEELAGGFVEMDAEDVAVYSAYGAKIRAFQPGYARPALAVGNTRFVVYNRAGTELTVESRTRRLYSKSFSNPIMLCAMAQNGTLAVVTESDRYAAEVQVFDPEFRGDPFVWKMTQQDGTPLTIAFAPDNRRFAAGTVAASDGQLRTVVRFMDTAQDTAGPAYTADTGAVILRLQWMSGSRVLAVFDTYVAVLNPSDGTELARYDCGGATLQSVSVGGGSTALLLLIRGGNTLVTLDEDLTPLATIPAGQAESVVCTDTTVYLLTDVGVESYTFDGVHNWSQYLGMRPQAVLDAARTLVFTPGKVDVLTAPES